MARVKKQDTLLLAGEEYKDGQLRQLRDTKYDAKLIRDMAMYRLAAISMADIGDYIVEDSTGIEVAGGACIKIKAPHELSRVARLAVKKVKITPGWATEAAVIEYELHDSQKASADLLKLLGVSEDKKPENIVSDLDKAYKEAIKRANNTIDVGSDDELK